MLKEYKNFINELQKYKMLMLSGANSAKLFNNKVLIPNKYKKYFSAIDNLVKEKGLRASELISELIKVVKAEINIKEELEIGISEAKIQIKILQFLPLIGLVFGFIIGANPVKTIFTSLIGLICALIGAIFLLIGKKWTNKLIKSTNLNFNTDFLFYISILKSCYSAGFSNTDCKREASEIYNPNTILNSQNSYNSYLEQLNEIIKLTEENGISPIEMLNDLYENIIDEEKINAKIQIGKVNGKLMLPLGACYLPSFIFIGLIPIIISMVQKINF